MVKVLFFGYGANKNRRKIAQIIGRDPQESVGALLEGYVLSTQNLNQIPDPPKELLRNLFGNDFKVYTIIKGEGVVQGSLFEITEEELNKISQWEFVPIWRQIIEVNIKSSGNKQIKAF